MNLFGLPLAFATPLLLTALAALPLLWFLLRLVPPRPRKIAFAPMRLLLDIPPKEETPARTPWWLTVLRLLLAAIIILAAAGPIWNPPVAGPASSGPVALLIDSGWPAAAGWAPPAAPAPRAWSPMPISKGAESSSFPPASRRWNRA